MPSGFITRNKGKIQASELWLGPGGIVDSNSGIASFPIVSQSMSLPVTAVATTDFTMSVPTGVSIVRMTAYTTIAYGAVTAANLTIGSSVGDASYVASVSIKALGAHALTLVAAGNAALMNMPSGTPNLFIRITQTGGSSSTGNALLVVEYT